MTPEASIIIPDNFISLVDCFVVISLLENKRLNKQSIAFSQAKLPKCN